MDLDDQELYFTKKAKGLLKKNDNVRIKDFLSKWNEMKEKEKKENIERIKAIYEKRKK